MTNRSFIARIVCCSITINYYVYNTFGGHTHTCINVLYFEITWILAQKKIWCDGRLMYFLGVLVASQQVKLYFMVFFSVFFIFGYVTCNRKSFFILFVSFFFLLKSLKDTLDIFSFKKIGIIWGMLCMYSVSIYKNSINTSIS